jgi:hypothetical protein
MRFLLAAVVIPPLVVAATALTHPASLSLESAEYWKNLHIWLLVWFPLLGLGPWLVARAVDRVTSRVVAVAAYTYATFYTALDVLGGIGGGAIKDAEAGGLGILFPIAGDFEQIGGIALVLASALAAGVAMQAVGWAQGALPAVAVLLGSYILWQEHIFKPWGPVAMLLLAAGWGAFVVLIERRQAVPA